MQRRAFRLVLLLGLLLLACVVATDRTFRQSPAEWIQGVLWNRSTSAFTPAEQRMIQEHGGQHLLTPANTNAPTR